METQRKPGELLIVVNCTFDEPKHEVLVDRDDRGQAKIPSGVRGVESGVKKKSADGENYKDYAYKSHRPKMRMRSLRSSAMRKALDWAS